MKTFIFRVQEVHTQLTKVKAETLEEAIDLINEGAGEEVGDLSFDYAYRDVDQSDLVEEQDEPTDKNVMCDP